MSCLRLVGLAAVVVVTGHQAVLMAGRGGELGSGLAATAHPAVWAAGVAMVLALLLIATSWVAWRVVALRWRLRNVPSLRVPRGERLLRAWAAIAITAVAIFLVQENAEHLAAHGHLPLLASLLDGQYAATLPIFAGVALLVAVASLLLSRRIADLRAACVRVARARHRPPPRIGWRGRVVDGRLRARMATACMARRGPPAWVPT